MAYWIHADMPAEILDRMNPRQRVLDGAGGPLRRLLASRALRGKDNREIASFIRKHGPKDIARHWDRVEQADGLAFIAPAFWLGYPAILKGW
jgi:NAD(P)H dehydrogenase (quinone)